VEVSAEGDSITDVPPDPAALVESLRAFGYSLPAAVADLVDNSVSARASTIEVEMHWAGEDSWIGVRDDGAGMGADELTNAMRLGSRSPREVRAAADLGRFGLGLKTAGFSQGRRVTVASHTAREPVAVRQWDLDFITECGAWSLLMDAPPARASLIESLGEVPAGTLVVIDRLDRATDAAARDDVPAQDRFLEEAEKVETHLGMIFHDFIQRGVNISVNGQRVNAWDPFLSRHHATQRLPAETHTFEGGTVRIQPFVLPFHTKLSMDEHRQAAGPGTWNAQQGFYIYRAGRLLVAGDYLGLGIAQEEHYKLCRIRVDIDNSMDLAWQIDVRKATARVPGPLRQHFLRIARRTRAQAREAYAFRGKVHARTPGRAVTHVWQRRVKRDREVRYTISRTHPLVKRVLDGEAPTRSSIVELLDLVEETLPIVSLMQDAGERPEELTARGPFDGRTDDVLERLKECHTVFVDSGVSAKDALDRLAGIEPFVQHPEVVATYAEREGLRL
jgi:hypothetical protein